MRKEAARAVRSQAKKVKLTAEDITSFNAKINKEGPWPDRNDPRYSELTERCWDWTAARMKKTGYGEIKTSLGMSYAHRIAFLIANGHFPKKGMALHKCDRKHCVNPSHLYDGTHGDNMRDRVVRGQSGKGRKVPEHQKQRGEKCSSAKLTEAIVKAIRTRYAKGKIFQRQLATEFGVHQTQIHYIVTRKHWPHVA